MRIWKIWEIRKGAVVKSEEKGEEEEKTVEGTKKTSKSIFISITPHPTHQ